ncbi:TPA: hypothetical protein PTV74_003371 [Clostridium botulinum]|nr:hypothetical protein [Clostridium botulinum]HDK7206523.1 hypothetical protein [Clostridium botulinum]HDK7210258.1 hypothetical protein [Clostridium botulinum]HDK7265708.1 hypothetical protein [Clostridium botulinum]HDK7269555.1 hypothetical protein [Clostridium botulinum]
MENRKEFAVSVADAIIRDIKTKQIIMIGKALIDTSLKQAIQNKEVRGGFGNALQYEFAYNKVISCEITSANFKEEYIAMNNGVPIVSQMAEYWNYNEKIKVKSGKVTLKDSPVAGTNVYVELPNKTIETVVPVGKTVTLTTPMEDDAKVSCTYRVKDVIDTITIDAEHYPMAYELTLIEKIFDSSGRQSKEMQIEIPEWKVEGNFDLNLKADDVTVPKIAGKALIHNDEYATIKMKRMDGEEVPIQQIAVTEAEVSIEKGSKYIPQVLGIRGGVYGNVPIPLDRLDMKSSDALKVKVTPDNSLEGLAVGTAKITVTLKDDPSKKDIIEAECTTI